MFNKILLSGLALVLTGLLACATREVTPAATKKPAETISPAREDWEVKWEKTLFEARKEGKIVWYGEIGPELREALPAAFKKSYSGIEFEMVSGRGAELGEKILRLHKAGVYQVDVLTGGTSTPTITLKPTGVLEYLEPYIILPEVKDTKYWWNNRFPWHDKDKTVINYTPYISGGLLLNYELLKPEELNSYFDLLKPRFKGKIAMSDPTIPGKSLMVFNSLGAIIGVDFWKELVKQEPVLTRDLRQLTEWAAFGKQLVAIGAGTETILQFKLAGAKIMEYNPPKDGGWLTSGLGNVSLLKDAPHKNAAIVFINWLLTKESQDIWAKLHTSQSARLDVPADHLAPEFRRKEGVNYFFGNAEEIELKRAEQMKLAREIFAPLLK